MAANLLTSAQPDGGWTPVCAIMGMAGVGKSALALRVARQLRGSFPDGQIGVNLGELEAADTDPQPALRELLTALGVEERALPRGVRDLTRLYQRRLLGRRLLILLDDVATEQQLRPLLPVADGCRVLVTTRNRLATMEGAHRIELGVLTAAESVELLARIVGPARVQREADAAARIAEACGGLPLAVRIAGARLITRPRWPLARLADRLADPQLVLDELRVADLDVAVSILRGYEQLSPDTRCALRVQSLLGSPSFTGSSAARALNRSVWAARELLDDLVSAHLLEIDDGSADHYRFHPLVRILLREQAWADETTLEYQQLSGLATGRNGSTYQVQVA